MKSLVDFIREASETDCNDVDGVSHWARAKAEEALALAKKYEKEGDIPTSLHYKGEHQAYYTVAIALEDL